MQHLATHIIMENRCRICSFQPGTVGWPLIAPADSQVEKIKVVFRTHSLLDIDLSSRKKGLKPASLFTLSLIRVQIHMPASTASLRIIIASWPSLSLVSHLCMMENCILTFKTDNGLWKVDKKRFWLTAWIVKLID